MKKRDIETREDVNLVVSTFYDKIRKDVFLGPFFNKVITDWPSHIERLTSFWETTLFTTKKLEHKYYGNPLEVHVKVDQENNQRITQEHFGNWINLWFETIDGLFEGEYASKAKHKAQKMSTFLYLNIFQARQ
ncbi:group III truncated hemoglobin [Formosa maritima]|uniref:Group III truncated hemoglobin n=1 Tax=Formosa maritima TaxID=2592046 RepID=A0A5D0G954_9FLAO|nr:group III truncated hemoglobin [Formosa maritima]TYA54342.1 group III truncated hemoglobin [Formosa maritima]